MSSTAHGRRVATSGHPLATSAGLGVLRAGGSSVDAALAMAFTQWVVAGPTCGPGGDLVLMHVPRTAGTFAPTVYGGWSRVPLRLQPEDLTSRGPLAAVVPGALAGADAAWRAGGRMPWPDLFTAALHHADGHVVTRWMEQSYASVDAKGNSDALRAILDQQRPPVEGETVSCRRLGASLERLANAGADDLYRGLLARRLCSAASDSGALIDGVDLHAMAAVIDAPRVRHLDGLRVSVLPPPSQASITTELLAATTPHTDPTSRQFATHVAGLTRQALIDRCVVGVPGTAACVAADDESAAVVIHSLAGVQYGSGWVAGETGIALGNRTGTALSARLDLPGAYPVPGAALPHTLSAALFESGGRTMLVATPGGDRQVQWLAQAGQRFRRGVPHDIGRLVDAPRWFVCPEGDRFGVPAGIDREWLMFAEPGIEWRDDADAAGFGVRPVENVGGGLQAITWDNTDGWHAASDHRGGGAAGVAEEN